MNPINEREQKALLPEQEKEGPHHRKVFRPSAKSQQPAWDLLRGTHTGEVLTFTENHRHTKYKMMQTHLNVR